MATIEVNEEYGSRVLRGGDDPYVELHFHVVGTPNEYLAYQALTANSSPIYDLYNNGFVILTRSTLEVREVGDDIHSGVWRGTCTYILKRQIDDDAEVAFDTSGGSQHITQSLQTVNSYGEGGAPPGDYKGAIGVTDDGVEGTDIVVPVFNFTLKRAFIASYVSNAYIGTLIALTGRMNNAAFYGLASGECLFMGARGRKRPDTIWEIEFSFAGSPNVGPPGLTIGGITGVQKLGWDYVWVRYEMLLDPQAKRLVRRPYAAFVERVYSFGDFGLLGI